MGYAQIEKQLGRTGKKPPSPKGAPGSFTPPPRGQVLPFPGPSKLAHAFQAELEKLAVRSALDTASRSR